MEGAKMDVVEIKGHRFVRNNSQSRMLAAYECENEGCGCDVRPATLIENDRKWLENSLGWCTGRNIRRAHK
jgi:hypothetical protein